MCFLTNLICSDGLFHSCCHIEQYMCYIAAEQWKQPSKTMEWIKNDRSTLIDDTMTMK